MKNYTSFKTGGPAEYLIWPKDHNSLRDIIYISKEYSIQYTVLGGCTNLLIADRGIKGIVIMMNSFFSKPNIRRSDDETIYSDSSIKKETFSNRS